jgi:DNA-binding Lrp family transcriptional regulator
MNKQDSKILSLLQENCRLSVAEIAERINLSTSACHRRIKMLEQSGVIDGYSARLNAKQLGYGMRVYVEISLTSQSDESLERFEQAVKDCPEILECHLMSGESDYLVMLAARDTEHYQNIHRHSLSHLPGISSMKSNFILRTIQPWHGYLVKNS